jgi:hypothetical protein
LGIERHQADSDTTIGKTILDDSQARAVEERRTMFQRFASLRAERDKTMPPLEAAAAKARARLEEAQRNLDDARREALAAESARDCATMRSSRYSASRELAQK